MRARETHGNKALELSEMWPAARERFRRAKISKLNLHNSLSQLVLHTRGTPRSRILKPVSRLDLRPDKTNYPN
jgi:hypothetical protein